MTIDFNKVNSLKEAIITQKQIILNHKTYLIQLERELKKAKKGE